MPHLMNIETLTRHGRPEEPPTRPLITGKATGSAITELWDRMALASPYRELEQEELDPSNPAVGSASLKPSPTRSQRDVR
jgi:hypothetical protein